jgi:hypothetical protein
MRKQHAVRLDMFQLHPQLLGVEAQGSTFFRHLDDGQGPDGVAAE